MTIKPALARQSALYGSDCHLNLLHSVEYVSINVFASIHQLALQLALR
ncbi:hypothetical protein [Plesiomonas sp.]